MKTRLKTLKLLVILFSTFATTAAFCQSVIVWNGGNGTGTAIGAATNWVGGVSPNSANGDICQWDGTVPGNLFLTSSSANGGFNNGTPGVSFHIAAGHTGSWNLTSLIPYGSGNIALNAITVDRGAGAVSLGDGGSNVLNIILRPSSSGFPFPIHVWANNSTNAATINPNVQTLSGGGNPHTIQIDGTGDWIIDNALMNFDAGNNNNFIVKTNTGTMFWNPNSLRPGVSGIGSPIDIEGGRMVLTGTSSELGTQRVTNNNAIFEYAVNAAFTWSGPFDGTNGTIVVSAGTLTLSSTISDFSGNIILTNGGVLNVGGNQNAGVGGTGPLGTTGPISFKGGTLQFSVANTFDYSSRFSAAAGQQYQIDTAGQNVTFATGLSSSGGSFTKLGLGTLTLSGANTYTGPTTVSNGTLVVNSVGGDMNVSGGTLLEGGVGVVGTMNVAGNLNIDSGTVVATLNKSLSPSNTVYSVAGTLEYSGGTLKLLNDGPQLVNGDTFAIFNQPFSGTTIVSPGFTVQNNGDGSFTVTSVAPPPTVTATLSSGQLNLSWPAVWTGLHVQVQTNSLATGLGTNWVTLPGTDASNNCSIMPDISKQTVFYRLAP
jgi:autotransporter-associated beta strand protein